MNEPIIIWIAVVAIVLLAFILRMVEQWKTLAKQFHKSFRVFGLASQKEEFYCPGDECYELSDEDEL